MLRTSLILAGLLVAASPAHAQDRPTSNRPATELYVQLCQMCHMPDGNAAIKDMNFADGEWLHGSSIKELMETITNGVQGTAMMPFKGQFTEGEIAALARKVRSFDKKLK